MIDLHDRILQLGAKVSPTCKVVLLIINHLSQQTGYCFLSQRNLALRVGCSLNALKASLALLEREGYLKRLLARDVSAIGKMRGYAWVVSEDALGSEFDPNAANTKGQILTPSIAEGSNPDPTPTETKRQLEQINSSQGQILTGQDLTLSRSTSTSTLEIRSVGSGSPSRACEAPQGLPTAPTPKAKKSRAESVALVADSAVPEQAFKTEKRAVVAATEDETDRNRLREAIVAAFNNLDSVAVKASLTQNRRVWLQPILDEFKGDVEAACAWVAWKAPDLMARYGGNLEAQKVGKLVRQCAEDESALWLSGKLQERAALTAPAREPVALGALVRALVPQVEAPVAPKAAQVVRKVEVPSWWPAALGGLMKSLSDYRTIKRPTHHDKHWMAVLEALAVELPRASRVTYQGESLHVTVELPALGALEAVTEDAASALAHLVEQTELNMMCSVEFCLWEGPDEVAREMPWLLFRPEPEVELPKPAPTPAPQIETTPAPQAPTPSVRRAPTPTPPWWSEFGELLRQSARRAQYQDGDAAWAGLIKQLDVLRASAVGARYEADHRQLVVEVETLGELRGQWADCAREFARCAALALDLDDYPEVRIVELGEVAP